MASFPGNPTDPAARRLLWKAWIATDAPQAVAAPQVRAAQAKRAYAESAEFDAVAELLAATTAKPVEAVQALIRLIELELVGPHLTGSGRQLVMREAERLGIGRFEANLIIAAVQHRVRKTKSTPKPQAERIESTWTIRPDRPSVWRSKLVWLAVAAAVALETAGVILLVQRI